MSIIIPIFVWTVERSESGSGGMSFAEGRLPRAWSGEDAPTCVVYKWGEL
jgi:hypothetical protein